MNWGMCTKCAGWGVAPVAFKEKLHFLKCGRCGEPMYLTRSDPKEAAYPDRDRVEVGLMRQTEKP